MITKLFHKDVFFPKNADKSVKVLQQLFNGYVLSKHLKEHLEDNYADRSHDYLQDALEECLTTIRTNPQEAFEIELSCDYHTFGDNYWHVTKYCIRMPYNKTQDIVVAIRPYFDRETRKVDHKRNKIVTAWLNHRKDDHFTLDGSKYCSHEEWNKLISRGY